MVLMKSTFASTANTTISSYNTITGTAGHDWLNGTAGSDMIWGGDGIDHLWGRPACRFRSKPPVIPE
jgi:Ca2+-binding RTX toxin-like protein